MRDPIELKIIDNSDLILKALPDAVAQALEAAAIQAESHAKQLAPVDMGELRNSITHTVDKNEQVAYIGTNVEYAPYVEYGTGIYGEKKTGSGGKTWWVYVDGGGKQSEHAKGKRYTEAEARQVVAILRSKGLDAHMTQGIKPTHFLQKAITEHVDKYKEIIRRSLENA